MIKRPLEKPVLAVLTILCFLLESKLTIFGARPALTLLPVYYVGLRKGALKGALLGILIGAIADSLAGNLLGPNMLAMGSVGIMASIITGGFLRWTPLMGVIGLFAITWADGMISYAALSVFAAPPTSISVGAKILLVQASLNAFAGVLIKPADEH